MIEEENEENTYYICVPCKEKKGFYRLQTIGHENELNITLLDGPLAFKSSASRINLSNQADALNMKYDDYLKKLILGLKNDESENFLYERKEENFYIFRQHITMKIILAKFYLEQIDYTVAAEIFIDKINTVSNFYKILFEKYKEAQKIANEEKDEATEKLEKYIDLKVTTENELYSKFILILNEKKKRIAYLMNLVETFKKGVLQDPDSEFEEINNVKKSKSKTKSTGKTIKPKATIIKKKYIEVISESESETESQTDTEDEDYIKKITHKVQIEPEPSNKRKFDFFMEETSSKISLPKRLNSKNTDKLLNIDLPNKNEETSLLSSLDKIEISSKNTDNHSQDMLDAIFTCNEMIINKRNSIIEKEAKNSSETPDFCTQDLLDRL